MVDQEKVQEFVRFVKRLQTFDFVEGRKALAKLPPGVIELKQRKFTWKGDEYLRVQLSILDGEALSKLDLDEYAGQVAPGALKAGQLLQRVSSFEPEVIKAAQDFLPDGMITIEPAGGIGGINNHINNNNNKKRTPKGVYWPVTIEGFEG